MTSIKFANSPERHIAVYDTVSHRSYTFKTSEITASDPRNGRICLANSARQLNVTAKTAADVNRLWLAWANETPELVAIAAVVNDPAPGADVYGLPLERVQLFG